MAEPITREEFFLNSIANGESIDLIPITREEMFLAKAGGQDVKTPTPITRKEIFLSKIQSGGSSSGGENRFAQYINGSSMELTDEDFEGATKIKQYAFYNASNIKKATIPDNIKLIQANAFGMCSYLTEVHIGNGVSSIGNQAFYNCAQLITITIGSGITELALAAFTACGSLTNFTIESPIPSSISFSSSSKLTIDSLKNIINALVDYLGTENEGKYTLTLHSTSKKNLDNEGATAPDGLTWIAYAQSKGWNIA